MISGTPAKNGRPREMRRLPYGPTLRPARYSIDELCREEGLSHVDAAIDRLQLNGHDLCGVPAGVAEMFASEMSHALNGIFLNPYDHARSMQQRRILPEKGQISAMNRNTPPCISYGGDYEMDWEASQGLFMRAGLQVQDSQMCLHGPPGLLLQERDELTYSITQ